MDIQEILATGIAYTRTAVAEVPLIVEDGDRLRAYYALDALDAEGYKIVPKIEREKLRRIVGLALQKATMDHVEWMDYLADVEALRLADAVLDVLDGG